MKNIVAISFAVGAWAFATQPASATKLYIYSDTAGKSFSFTDGDYGSFAAGSQYGVSALACVSGNMACDFSAVIERSGNDYLLSTDGNRTSTTLVFAGSFGASPTLQFSSSTSYRANGLFLEEYDLRPDSYIYAYADKTGHSATTVFSLDQNRTYRTNCASQEDSCRLDLTRSGSQIIAEQYANNAFSTLATFANVPTATAGNYFTYDSRNRVQAVLTAFHSPAAVQAAVPEASTWAMMIAGFGIVGGAMRRRNKITTALKFA